MDSTLRTSTFVVLAIVSRSAPVTAYDMKRLAKETMSDFWSVPHTVIYSETRRLTEMGLLESEEEPGGRRRRLYSLSPEGRSVFEHWLAEPTGGRRQTYDPGLLKIYAGADPREVARDQYEVHRQQLVAYETILRKLDPEQPHGSDPVSAPGGFEQARLTTLAAGIRTATQYLQFWEEVRQEGRVRPRSAGL